MSKERKIEEFLNDYRNLVKKHGVDFATFPMFVPDGTEGGFKIVCQSTPVDLGEMEKHKERFMRSGTEATYNNP